MPNAIDLTGQRFGRLLVQALYSGGPGIKHRKWSCLCDCGNRTIVFGGSLRSGQSTSCDCLRRDRVVDSRTLPGNEAGIRLCLRTYKYSAQKRELEWSLTDQDFRNLINSNCWYCGRPPTSMTLGHERKTSKSTYTANGIDRIDNTIGYTFTNSVPCCQACNYMKRDLPLSDFLDHVKRLSHLASPVSIFPVAE